MPAVAEGIVGLVGEKTSDCFGIDGDWPGTGCADTCTGQDDGGAGGAPNAVIPLLCCDLYIVCAGGIGRLCIGGLGAAIGGGIVNDCALASVAGDCFARRR